jgi:crotonobetaine/carnitine-CoA ligase
LKLGAIQVPINTGYKGEFLRHQLFDCGAKVFIVQGDYVSRATEIVGAEGTPMLTHCITVDPPDAIIDTVPAIRWADAMARGGDDPIDVSHVRPSDLACFHLHGRHDGPEQGLHAAAELHRQPRRPDRAHLAARAQRRDPHSAAAVPLQRDLRVRRSGRC